MKCSICKTEIEKQEDEYGKVIWDKGHNAHPINNGRCCGICNESVISK